MNLTRRSMLAAAGAAAATLSLPRAALAEPAKRLAPPALLADLEMLLDAYGSVHPGLQRYLPPGGFAARVAAARDWAGSERSLGETFVMLARLTAAVRCGHSYPNPHNQSEPVAAALFGGRDRVPFAFRWIDGRMIVTGGRGRGRGGDGDAPIPVGSEVTAIDGTPARELLRRMLPLARADGGNDFKRVAQLGVDSRQRFAAFDVYRPLLAPVRGDGSIDVRFRRPDRRDRNLALPARTEQELEALRPTGDAGIGWTVEIGADRIGRLTMPSWTTYNSRWDWRAYLDSALDRLIDERASGLVVDLRGNEGGTECGWHLLERLLAADLELPAFVRRVRYRRLPDRLRAAFDTWDDGFRDWGPAAIGPDAAGFYRLERGGEEPDRLRPRGRRFAGPVAVLVDSACSSATFQFANALKGSGIATLVGEPTGGNRRGLNGDAYFFVRLPGSGLEVDLPIVGSFATTPQPDAGVVPDIVIPVTAADIAAGRDRAMVAALAAVRSA